MLLASAESARVPVRRDDYKPFDGRLSAAPTTARAFGPEEEVEAYREVYLPERGRKGNTTADELVVTAALHASSGEVVSDVPVTVGVRERGIGGGRVYPVRAAFQTAALPQGDYVLEFSVGTTSAATERRRVAFSVD